MEKTKRKKYLKYPKIITVTCVTCGKVVEVLLKSVLDYRRRFYCSEECEQRYVAMARRQANAKRTGGGDPEYKPAESLILAERPAACSSPQKRKQSPGDEAKAAREKARRQRDLEYWSALRRAKGIGTRQAE